MSDMLSKPEIENITNINLVALILIDIVVNKTFFSH
jgi:hypothetical protein